eukprot:2222110-Lingulodinium_polyedra.AAC.1
MDRDLKNARHIGHRNPADLPQIAPGRAVQICGIEDPLGHVVARIQSAGTGQPTIPDGVPDHLRASARCDPGDRRH